MKPILFNVEMVQAILDGRKTVTRRPIKGLPVDAEFTGWLLDSTLPEDGKDIGKVGFKTNEPTEKCGSVFVKPPYEAGDILYVRETIFQAVAKTLTVSGETESYFVPIFEYLADGNHTKGHWQDERQYYWMSKRPSIHMPKEAARIFLRVKEVRVERLQEMVNFRAEGIKTSEQCDICHAVKGQCHPDTASCDNEVDTFANLWNSTINKSDLDRYSWNANPWVWVIEFERISNEKVLQS